MGYNMEYALYNFKIYQGVDKYIPFIFYSLNSDQKVYDNFDFEFIDHEYKNSWSGWGIDTKIVLKEFLFIFNINSIINIKI